MGEERISDCQFVSSYGSLLRAKFTRILLGEIQQVAICIRSTWPLRRPEIVVVIVEVSWLWLLVVDILLLLGNIALVVVCHMKLTVLEWLSSLITYILPY